MSVSRSGKIYYKYPRYVPNPEHPRQVSTVVGLNFSMPPADLAEAYEEKKRKFTEQLNRETERSIHTKKRNLQRGGGSKKVTPKETAYILGQKGKKTQKQIAEAVLNKFGL